MPSSQIIPPSPSPTESKILFYTSVSLLLSRIFPTFVSMVSESVQNKHIQNPLNMSKKTSVEISKCCCCCC